MAELVELGPVRRAEDTADGRSYAIELTEHGRAVRARFAAELGERFAEHLRGWSDAEVADFAERLAALVASLAGDVPAVPAPTAVGRNPWRTP